MAEVERNLGEFTISLIIEVLSERIHLLVNVRVDDLVTEIVVSFLFVGQPLS
jgi:hypothetical protein